MARFQGIAAIAALIVILASAQVVAEPVRMRAASHGDFGRIVFTWGSPVGHKLNIEDGGALIRFSRPIESSYTNVVRALSKYLTKVSPGDDGRSVWFALTGSYDVYSYDSGLNVIVEIAEMEGDAGLAKTAPEPKAGDEAGKAGDLYVVKVRSGVHADYTRVVFDWVERVSYRLKQDGGEVTVAFDRPAEINVKPLQSRLPRFIGGIRSVLDGKGVRVTLSVPASSKVRHFLSGAKVVLDVPRPAAGDTAKTLTAKLPDASPVGGAEAQIAQTTPEASTSNTGTGARVAKSAALTEFEVAAPPVPTSQPTAMTPNVTVTQPASAMDQAQPAPTAAQKEAVSATPSVTTSKPTALIPSGTVTQPPLAKEQEAPALVPTEAVSVTPVTVSPDAVSLRFDWDTPVAAALFRRAGILWIAFDKPTTVDTDALKRAGGNIIRSVQQIPAPNGTVLRMSTVSGINPLVQRDGLSWLLHFQQQELKAQTAIETRAQPYASTGSRIFLPVPEPGSPIGVTDPEVGDNLIIVPVVPIGHGNLQENVYPEVVLLPTAQGIVVKPKIDDIRVRVIDKGIELTGANPLQLSPVTAESKEQSRLAAAKLKPTDRILDLEKWALPELSSFISRKRALQNEIKRALGDQREPKRMDLARFYFANGFGAEAFGVLKRIAADRSEIEEVPEFRLLRGGANYLMTRYSEAAADFAHYALDNNDEAAFWRAATLAHMGETAHVATELQRKASILKFYPKKLKALLGTQVVEVAVQMGDISQARKLLDLLKSDEPTPLQKAHIDYLEGKLLVAADDMDGAVTKWDEAMTGPHPGVRAQAAWARIEALLKLDRLTAKQATNELERLRFAWRGDDFEFNLLRRLGTLYLETGSYRKGLIALRQAATFFRNHEQAPQITQQMADTFSFLYLEKGAESLPPVAAIALHDEFKELTPAGARGDEMIRKLADRMVGVELFDRAGSLLQKQVRFRLKGTERSRVGTQLALIRLLSQDYEGVLNVLDETVEVGLTEQLTTQRKHLRARALMGLEARGDALNLLKDDKTIDGNLIKLEIQWGDRDWQAASQSLRRIILASGILPGQKLDDEDANKVLNIAVAYTLSDNDRAVARLRREYGPAMDQTVFKDAFHLISSPRTFGLVDPTSVATRVKDVENFQTFLTAYKERLKKKSLSSVVPDGSAAEQAPRS